MSIGIVWNAWVINIWDTWKDGKNSVINKISESTFELGEKNQDVKKIIENTWFSVLSSMKLIISALIVAYLVYNGALMIMANGSNDDNLSKSKRQFIYAGVGLLFINIPWTILSSVFQEEKSLSEKNIVADSSWFNDSYSIFLNDVFGHTIQTNIIGFLQVIISAIAILWIILSWIQMLVWRGNEDKMSKLKSRVIYSGFALVFVWVMELFKEIVFTSDFIWWKNLFDALADLALYFAAPVAISFLIYAGYQLITSNGDEQKMNNAKTIVTNVLLAVLIVLSSWAILAELNF